MTKKEPTEKKESKTAKEPTKRNKKEYWGLEEEKAVADYLALEPGDPKCDFIFEQKIYGPIRKLVENIMFRYNLVISELPVDEQIDDTIGFVVLKMRRFDTERGPKSFSYYGTVAKNYMIMKKKKHYKNKITSVDIDSILGFEIDEELYEDHQSDIEIKTSEYLLNLAANTIEEKMKTDLKMGNNVYKIGEVIVYLLRNYQYITVYNKRQFYFVAREFTGMSAKEITKALKSVKELFKEIQKSTY